MIKITICYKTYKYLFLKFKIKHTDMHDIRYAMEELPMNRRQRPEYAACYTVNRDWTVMKDVAFVLVCLFVVQLALVVTSESRAASPAKPKANSSYVLDDEIITWSQPAAAVKVKKPGKAQRRR
jgi:hypothetical protein